MDLVYCGTPPFAVPALEALVAAGHRVKLVVTQPDRPRGRGLELAASAVKQVSQRLGLPITQPEQIRNNAEFRAQMESLRPDAIIVVGYGRIIPAWMLALPKHGNINLHASLLPKYRGAAPIQWAIANGETVSGNTTMRLNEGLDTGDILLQQELSIAPDDTALTYGQRLAGAGARLLLQTLDGLEKGTLTSRPQDHTKATLAPILKKEDGRVDFSRPAQQICDRWRGFQPWPGAFTTFRGKQLTLSSFRPITGDVSLEPCEIIAKDGAVFVGCRPETAIELIEVQPEGKKRMSARDFANGHRLRSGERLG
ncbi:MAG: methionyl-tRNA formyltransferase [Acidobacteriales bacterium]|nr:methionyl-tRNA formyltransferase [Terriglobales bacterium]